MNNMRYSGKKKRKIKIAKQFWVMRCTKQKQQQLFTTLNIRLCWN